MRYPPEIQAALDDEQRSRLLAYLPCAPDLLGCPVVHFTPRIRLELELADNAFLAGREPRAVDVFALLWRLHPLFRRPDGTMPNARRPRSRSPLLRLRSLRARRRIARKTRLLLLPLAAALIASYLSAVFRDRPAGTLSEHEPRSLIPKPAPHWLDDLTDYFAARYGWSIDAILDTPQPLLLQLWRAHAIAAGIEIIDPSAELIGRWVSRTVSPSRN
jgi:hypothetical protein